MAEYNIARHQAHKEGIKIIDKYYLRGYRITDESAYSDSKWYVELMEWNGHEWECYDFTFDGEEWGFPNATKREMRDSARCQLR